jgi:hypothetical protein
MRQATHSQPLCVIQSWCVSANGDRLRTRPLGLGRSVDFSRARRLRKYAPEYGSGVADGMFIRSPQSAATRLDRLTPANQQKHDLRRLIAHEQDINAGKKISCRRTTVRRLA